MPSTMIPRRPPSLLIVIAVFLGVGPCIWLFPIVFLAAIESGTFPSLGEFAGAPIAAVFFAGFWWLLALRGLWALTVGPTAIAAVATWSGLKAVSAFRPELFTRRWNRVLWSAVLASGASAIVFLAFLWVAPGPPPPSLMPSGIGPVLFVVAFVGASLGVLTSAFFKQAAISSLMDSRDQQTGTNSV